MKKIILTPLMLILILGFSTMKIYAQDRPPVLPNSPTNLVATPGDGTLSLTWDAPEGSVINYYSVSYTGTDGEELKGKTLDDTTSHTLTGLRNGFDYVIKVLAITNEGSSEYSESVTVSPDDLSGLSIIKESFSKVTENDRVSFSWSTSKPASTKVSMGLLDIGGYSTEELDISEKVTDHSVTITSLIPCTKYYYSIYSRDGIGQEMVGSESEFTTSGCEGSADIEDIQTSAIEILSGGIIDFSGTDLKTKFTIPGNFVSGGSDVIFQAKKLSKGEVFGHTSCPSGLNWLGGHVYKFNAYTSETLEVDSFEQDVTISIGYDASDLNDIDVNSLSMYHHDDQTGDWTKLTNCSNDYDGGSQSGTISCSVDNFSAFALSTGCEITKFFRVFLNWFKNISYN